MLKYKLLHPEILEALAGAGHGSQVLVCDGNYPASTGTYPDACLVYLNLRPGSARVTDILEVLADAIPIEAAHVMQPADGSTPPVFLEFERILPGICLQRLERFAFYDAARQPTMALAVVSGDQRLYANILLTIGVVAP